MKNKELYNRFKDLSQDELNYEFYCACQKGKLKLVKYLLTSSDLKYHANVRFNKYLNRFNNRLHDDAGFTEACFYGHFEVVKFLLTAHELKEYPDIHARNDTGFISALFNRRLDILQFLIFDMNIEKTEHIEKYLKENPNKQVENMFQKRDLNNKLEEELYCDRLNDKKMKV